jgi:RNA recognition motif-containing protein
VGGPDIVGVESRCVSLDSLNFLDLIDLLAWFRLFAGDLSNDVSDDVLANAFSKYPSFQKARVKRDRLSGKVSHRQLVLAAIKA